MDEGSDRVEAVRSSRSLGSFGCTSRRAPRIRLHRQRVEVGCGSAGREGLRRFWHRELRYSRGHTATKRDLKKNKHRSGGTSIFAVPCELNDLPSLLYVEGR